jgi:HEPN domain-containing protein
MNEADRWVEARRWLAYAREDLTAARSMSESGVPRHICWLAQQAGEKALKAVLVFLQVDFPFRHDLDALRNLIPDGWAVKTACPDLAELTEWAVESRYPGTWLEATEADAKAAVEQATSVYDSVSQDLKRFGHALDDPSE